MQVHWLGDSICSAPYVTLLLFRLDSSTCTCRCNRSPNLTPVPSTTSSIRLRTLCVAVHLLNIPRHRCRTRPFLGPSGQCGSTTAPIAVPGPRSLILSLARSAHGDTGQGPTTVLRAHRRSCFRLKAQWRLVGLPSFSRLCASWRPKVFGGLGNFGTMGSS